MAFLNGGESCEQFAALLCAVRIGLELYLVGKIAVIRTIEVLPDNGVAAGKTASLGGFLHNVWILVEKVLGSGIGTEHQDISPADHYIAQPLLQGYAN